MKTRHTVLPLGILFLFLAGAHFGCSSSSPASSVNKTAPNYGYTNLLEMLRKEPQLMITGPTNNPEIRVRGGGRSISGSNEPLFVLDGATVGRGYNSVRSIDVNIVQSITVISAARAGKYGSMGGNGVIEIKTK